MADSAPSDAGRESAEDAREESVSRSESPGLEDKEDESYKTESEESETDSESDRADRSYEPSSSGHKNIPTMLPARLRTSVMTRSQKKLAGIPLEEDPPLMTDRRALSLKKPASHKRYSKSRQSIDPAYLHHRKSRKLEGSPEEVLHFSCPRPGAPETTSATSAAKSKIGPRSVPPDVKPIEELDEKGSIEETALPKASDWDPCVK